MKRRTAVAAVAASAALVMAISACGGSKPTSSDSTTGAASYNAAIGKVANPSTKKGGTLTFANSGDWDSLDPADTYYGYSWDFIRLYGRALTMFAPKPGNAGVQLVPDLATSLGKSSPDAKTWTYTLRSGLKFEDGSPITSKDVKYAVERSLDKNIFVNGPTYFNDFLDLQGYTSPYNDPTPDKLGLKAIETPDDTTIIFHLSKPFGGFDYLAMLPATIPVPRAKDTGIKYKEHVVSSGPYMFDTNNQGKDFSLKRNPNWDPSTDPNRTALPDQIKVQLHVNADDIDNRLLAGDLDVFVEGTGVGTSAQGKIIADQNLKKNTDLASITRVWFSVVNSDVAPLDNIHCRKAVEYATDHEGLQRAYGGSVGGDIATSLLPPQIPGAQKIDLYNAASKPNGDTAMAKQELQACGKPDGFSTNISYRAERPKEKATAESLQQALAKVGINLTLKPYPLGDYAKLYAGKPDFAKTNNLGIMVYGWGADWPDGFGFLQQIVDSRVIRTAGGNTNLGIKIPEVDSLIDKALVTSDAATRNPMWGQIDKLVMENAEAIPGVWAKSLDYRSPNVTNAYINDGLGGYYDYAWMGVK
jgi:peptide/nickel transport system substrate-binding protein